MKGASTMVKLITKEYLASLPPLACPKPQKSKKLDKAQLGKRSQFVEELVEQLMSSEVFGCEVCYLEHREGKRQKPDQRCYPIDPAHRHDRDEYYSHPESLWTKNQVIMAGRYHHQMMDRNKELREETFNKLRGEDELPKS